MTPNEYQTLAMRTASGISTSCPENLLLQGVMGMCGEAGEAIDIVKKVAFQGHELNEATKEHLIRELGDVLWYVATTAEALGVQLETVMQTNIDKLRARYPMVFDSEKLQERRKADSCEGCLYEDGSFLRCVKCKRNKEYYDRYEPERRTE